MEKFFHTDDDNNLMINMPEIYAITDSTWLPNEKLFSGVEAALMTGCKWIQYREKEKNQAQKIVDAKKILDLCLRYNAKLIINDDVELAKEINAHGVHLGQEDCNPVDARKLLGAEKIIGVTCHDSIKLAQTAIEQSANYIAFGRFFPSLTKPNAKAAPIEIIQQARNQFGNIPIAVIGGITLDNASLLIRAGADLIAVSGGLFNTTDVRSASEKFNNLLI